VTAGKGLQKKAREEGGPEKKKRRREENERERQEHPKKLFCSTMKLLTKGKEGATGKK